MERKDFINIQSPEPLGIKKRKRDSDGIGEKREDKGERAGGRLL